MHDGRRLDRFRLVVGVDGSAAAREALRWASRFATVLGGEILVAHALPGGDPEAVEKRRREIQEVVESEWCVMLRGEGAPFQVVVRPADPVELLVELAAADGNVDEDKDEDAGNGGNGGDDGDVGNGGDGSGAGTDVDPGNSVRRLVVLGNSGLGHPGPERLDLGSTCRGVLSARRLPALVVTRRDRAAAHLALRRILVGVDDRPAADDALAVACAVAKGFRSWVHVVHAADEGAASRAEVLRDRVAGLDLPVHVSVERGEPAEVIRAVAARLDADLVVVGSNDRVDDVRSVHPAAPSVSRQVVRSVQRPTLVVPDDPATPGSLVGEEDLCGA